MVDMDESDDGGHARAMTSDDEDTGPPGGQPPSSLHTLPRRHFYLTRRGKILQSTSERYLRDDLGYGSVLVPGAGDGGAGGRRKTETIAGKVERLVPRTIDDVPLLLDVVRSPAAAGRGDGAVPARLAVVDANVLLHHMDVLEYLRDEKDGEGRAGGSVRHRSVADALVIPQTALEECRHRSLVMYRRASDLVRSSSSSGGRAVIVLADAHHVDTQPGPVRPGPSGGDGDGPSANDVNDARLRGVARYYGRAVRDHLDEDPSSELRGNVEVVFLTDDKASRRLAEEEQGPDRVHVSRSVREQVSILQGEDGTLNLLDLVAQFGTAPGTATGGGDKGGTADFYPPHVAPSDVSRGLRTGRYYQGVYRSDRDRSDSGYVAVRRGDDRVAVVIRGVTDVNRAVDGDVVAVELHPLDMWLGSGPTSGGGGGGSEPAKTRERAGAGASIAEETAEPSVRDAENVAEEVPLDESGEVTRKPTGKVAGIIRRNFHRNFCGSIVTVDRDGDGEEDGKDGNGDGEVHPHDAVAMRHEREHPDGLTSTVVFVSIDARVPPILIRTTQRDRLAGMRLLVSIDSWPADSEYPLGHYVRTLGETGTKDTETKVLLQEFRIPCEPFPAKVLACLPPADYKIELEPGRTDLRHLPVLSIDPPGCKDIDDALHCIELPNGNWQVGVHIADVTHYVEAGTAIDLEAADRSTSTYLVNRRLDMLPSLLTTDLCSLKGNVDRFAFTVLWEVTPDAEIVGVDFVKSIIHSIAALTYQQAQSLIDRPDGAGGDGDVEIQAGAVKRLARLARLFRKRRIDAGALTLASPEVKFVLDSESLNPTDVQAYTLYEANALVEEFMLLANVTVAKKILRHYPTLSILRRHPAPNRSMFDGLISKARTRGVSLCIDDSKKLADSLDAAGRAMSDDPYLDKLLRVLSTRCMSPAQYFCSGEYSAKDWHHYGLAAPVYTHFTSPIRRYADVCVHRLLASAIGVQPLPVFLSSKSHLHDLAANMNRRHRAAQLAGRASVQLHTLIFFAGDEGGGGGAKEEDAYVLDVDADEDSEPAFTVMVPRYGIEGKVRLGHIDGKDERLVRDPEKFKLSYKDGETGEVVASVKVFDKVRVRIWVRSSRDRRELVVDLLQPEQLASPKLREKSAAGSAKKRKKKQKTKP